jgi:hypothetical protein
MKMSEVNEAAKIITENADPSAKIIFGAYYDRKVPKGNLKINLIATGFNGLASAARERDKDVALFTPARFADEPAPLKISPKKIEEEVAEEDFTEETPDLFSKGKLENLFTSGEINRDIKKEEEESDSGDSMWDIPAFLRRKKKK